MAKNKNDYFALIEQQASVCVEASDFLEEMFRNYQPGNIIELKDRMHEIEHNGDQIQHSILTGLYAEFITPIDQEDILMLVQIIDDITDALDKVVQLFYMYHVDRIPADVPALSAVVNRCVKALHETAAELRNFKKPTELRKLLVKVNDIESEGDDVYMEAVYHLFGQQGDPRTLLGAREIYDSLENCCDLCEHAADVIEQVILKNT